MASSRTVVRTQIYLDSRDHRTLKRRARKAGISMTGLVRRIVSAYLRGDAEGPAAGKEALMRFVGLGASGRSGVSRDHHRAIEEAMRGSGLR